MIKYREHRENKRAANHAMELYNERKNEEIINFLMGYEDITDSPLMCYLLAQALLNESEKASPIPAEAMVRISETLLRLATIEGRPDPDVLYQKARCGYFREYYLTAIFELKTALSLDEEKYEYFRYRGEAKSLLDDCLECAELTEALYTDEQREAVIGHIDEYFGKPDRIFTSDISGRRLDVAVIPPDEEKNFCTLVTIGAGAYPMLGIFHNNSRKRAELIMLIPADKQDEAERYSEVLVKTASLIGEKDAYIVPGITCEIYKPNVPELPYEAMSVVSAGRISEGSDFCKLSEKIEIAFYQLFPFYDKEVSYSYVHGFDETVKAIDDKLAAMGVFVSDRPNTRKRYDPEKDNALKCEEVDFTKELRGVGEFCLCSRRIINDGCNVARMFRLNPFEAEIRPFSDNDSGWVFTAGDEDTEYFINPNNLALFPLNTLVNLCYDVMPHLDNPIGTMLIRKADGKLHVTLSSKWKE